MHPNPFDVLAVLEEGCCHPPSLVGDGLVHGDSMGADVCHAGLHLMTSRDADLAALVNDVTQVQAPPLVQTHRHWDADAPVHSSECLPVQLCSDSSIAVTGLPDLPPFKRARVLSHTAQVSQQSVMSFLLTLQTQEATVLATSLQVRGAKARVSRPLVGPSQQSLGELPLPPLAQFLSTVPGVQHQLESSTTPFYGVVHSFENDKLMVQVPGNSQLQVMVPGHHYLMVVRPQHVQRALQLYQKVKASSVQPTSVVLVTQATVAALTPCLQCWNTLQSVPSQSLYHPGRPRKWTALTDFVVSNVGDQSEVTYEFKSGQHSMAVTANLAGAVHTILLDSGASGTA